MDKRDLPIWAGLRRQQTGQPVLFQDPRSYAPLSPPRAESHPNTQKQIDTVDSLVRGLGRELSPLDVALMAAPLNRAAAFAEGANWWGDANAGEDEQMELARRVHEFLKSKPATFRERDLPAYASNLDRYEEAQRSALRRQLGIDYALPTGSLSRGYAEGGRVGALGRLAARMHGAPRHASPLNVIKEKGGNWLTGSVEDALSGLKRTREPLNMEQTQFEELTPSSQALNSWIDKQLTRYVKNEMATPQDPVRALAERGVLHVAPEELNFRPEMYGKYPSHTGHQFLANNPAAKQWEGASDNTISSVAAKYFPKEAHGPFNLVDQPWAAKLAPETLVHGLEGPGAARDLGFPHLIDELSNALDPESGLPRHLQLRPESLQRMGMANAVEHVAKINDWRAAQKAEASKKLLEGVPTVREYAENNPKGLRWVELKAPSGLPEGYQIQPTESGVFDVINPKGDRLVARTPEEAERMAWGEVRAMTGKHPLSDQLRYEGDTMGHCVGGYCDDILSGRSRIFSLRDAKGEPHVTVEVSPRSYERSSYGVPDDIHDKLEEQAYQEVLRKNPGIDEESDIFRDRVMNRASELADAWFRTNTPPPSIVQIKGKQNRAPNPEYLPFVQDFVRNSPLGQPWSDVGDFRNTGLFDLGKLGKGRSWSATDYPLTTEEWGKMYYLHPDMSPDKLYELLRAAHPEDQYITQDELRKIALGATE